MRFYLTGTDTGVGKTRATAVVARALAARASGPPSPVTIVKLVQTGLAADEPGDAAEAGALAGCAFREVLRYPLPADPWSAALDAGAPPPQAAELVAALDALPGSLVVEGSGGAAVPLNATESVSDAAHAAGCTAIVVVGLRLGCINHALLTLHYLAARGVPTRGVLLAEPWEAVPDAYVAQVERALVAKTRILGRIAYDTDAAGSVARSAAVLNL